MTAMQRELLDGAHRYLDRGWSVVALKLSADEKKTAHRWKKLQTKPASHRDLEKWFVRDGVNGVGVIHGVVSGKQTCRDFDTAAAYHQFVEREPKLAKELPTTKTARGFHVHCRSDLPKIVHLGDGEFRGAGLSVLPYSVRPLPTGGVFRYDWLIGLPAGDLPFVPHEVLVGKRVAEKAEAIISDISATSSPLKITLSAFSATDVDLLIGSTLPTKAGERNACILKLARGLKFNAGIADAGDDRVKDIVRRWHHRALSIIGTKDFDTTWGDFIHALDRARHPLGISLVDAAAEKVDPADLPEAAMRYESDACRKLVALCRELAVLNGGQRFFLSSHEAAERINVEPMQGWRMLKMLEVDRVIKCLERGNQYRASRYAWIGGGGET